MIGDDCDGNEKLQLLTLLEAAQSLRVSERTLWSMTKPRGPIPAVRLGRSVRYCPNTLRSWIAAQLVTAGSTLGLIGSKA